MEISTFETLVTGLTDKVWLISESEHPFSYTQFSASNSGGLPALLAQKHQADVQKIKIITPKNFLSKIEKTSASSDPVIVANTQNIRKLLEFLQQHLGDLTVYRVEAGVSVPVYILGFLPGGFCVGVSSISIET